MSEVLLGITWNGKFLHDRGDFFSLLERLNRDYPKQQTLGPIADEVMLANGIPQQFVNPNESGPVLYRFSDPNLQWLVQVQYNKIYLNWIRVDGRQVGDYPGYGAIWTRFENLLRSLSLTDIELKQVKYLDLTYQDRFTWHGQIESPGDVDEIMEMRIAALPQGANKSFFLASNYALEDLGGFASLQVQQPAPAGQDILSVQLSTKGLLPDVSLAKWFDLAHGVQTDFFQSFFKQRLLDSWR